MFPLGKTFYELMNPSLIAPGLMGKYIVGRPMQGRLRGRENGDFSQRPAVKGAPRFHFSNNY